MPWSLKRLQQSQQTHFVTFSCYRRMRFLNDAQVKRDFEVALESTRRSYGLLIYGYVVMPEHVHLLISEPERRTLAVAIQAVKQSLSRRHIGERQQFWQKRYYDHNVASYQKFVEKLRYIHRNPVKRGLCTKPDDWEWSSFRHYANGEDGIVKIESEWTARGRQFCEAKQSPTLATEARMGHQASAISTRY